MFTSYEVIDVKTCILKISSALLKQVQTGDEARPKPYEAASALVVTTVH